MQKNNNIIKIKYLIYLICVLGLFIIMGTISATAMRYYSTVSVEVVGYAKANRSSTYNVIFNANGGSGTMSSQQIGYGVSTNLNNNSFSKTGFTFVGWNTDSSGNGTSYDNNGTINQTSLLTNNELNLYAIWGEGNVRINGVSYDSITQAISANAIPTDDTETIVDVFADFNDNFTISQHMNVIINLRNHTISNNNINAVITNEGQLTVLNGTITSASKNNGTINNNSTGNLTINNVQVSMTGAGGKQALYNDKGIVEIKGNSIFTSVSTIRATVQNLAGGTLRVNGGTIISTGHQGINNAGTMSIGTKDGNVDYDSIMIQGYTYGINSTTVFTFYDGIIKGKSAAFNDRIKVGEKEDGHQVVYGSETIGGVAYETASLLESILVTFNANGGTTSEANRGVQNGQPVGTLPTCNRIGHIFNGWFTLPEGGTQISADTIITNNVTFYAQWTKRNVVEMNGTIYATFNEAITAAPNNTQTTLTLLETTAESFTVGSGKNIVIDLQNYTISNSNSNNAVIKNDGTLELINGTITSNSNSASIDNNSTGTLLINGTTITATGQKQALYNDGGIVEITGNAYLSSSASGKRENYDNLERGTVQNLPNGTITITDATIIANVQHAISNEGTLILGVKDDGNLSNTSPLVVGKVYGVNSIGTFNYYDGVIKGISEAILGTVSEMQSNTQIKNDTELINTDTYKTVELEAIP